MELRMKLRSRRLRWWITFHRIEIYKMMSTAKRFMTLSHSQRLKVLESKIEMTQNNLVNLQSKGNKKQFQRNLRYKEDLSINNQERFSSINNQERFSSINNQERFNKKDLFKNKYKTHIARNLIHMKIIIQRSPSNTKDKPNLNPLKESLGKILSHDRKFINNLKILKSHMNKIQSQGEAFNMTLSMLVQNNMSQVSFKNLAMVKNLNMRNKTIED
jgi:hypothetical protein